MGWKIHTLKVPVHQVVDDGSSYRVLGWLIDVQIPAPGKDEARIAVTCMQEAYRAYDGSLWASERRGWDGQPLNAKSLELFGERLQTMIDSGAGSFRNEDILDYPFKPSQARAVHRGDAIRPRRPQDEDASWYNEEALRRFAAAEMEVRSRMEGAIVVDGHLWSRTSGPAIVAEPDEAGRQTIARLALKSHLFEPGSHHRRSDAAFSIFDRDRVREAYAQQFRTVWEDAHDLVVRTEEGWSRAAISTARSVPTLENISRHVLANMRNLPLGDADGELVRGFLDLQASREGPSAMLGTLQSVVEWMSGILDRSKLKHWQASLSALESIGFEPLPGADELSDLRL